MARPQISKRKRMDGWINKQCVAATTAAALLVSVFRSSWMMPLIPAHYYRGVGRPFFSRNGKYLNALKCCFWEVNPQEVWDQGCTSVVVWLVFSLISLLASEHRWRFICCLFPLDSFSFSIPIFLPPLSRACLPAEALYLTARLSDSLSFSCGRRPPSVAVTANRHAEGPFQVVI